MSLVKLYAKLLWNVGKLVLWLWLLYLIVKDWNDVPTWENVLFLGIGFVLSGIFRWATRWDRKWRLWLHIRCVMLRKQGFKTLRWKLTVTLHTRDERLARDPRLKCWSKKNDNRWGFMVYEWNEWFFRIAGFGLGLRDHRVHPALFSLESARANKINQVIGLHSQVPGLRCHRMNPDYEGTGQPGISNALLKVPHKERTKLADEHDLRNGCHRIKSGAETTCSEATPVDKWPNAAYWCRYCKRHFVEIDKTRKSLKSPEEPCR